MRREASAPMPFPDDRPLIDRSEMRRTESSLRTYMLSEDERQAIIAQYGAPTQPLHKIIALTDAQRRRRPSI